MKTIAKMMQIILMTVFFFTTGFAKSPVIENRIWVLVKFKDPQTREVLYPENYHGLEFKNGHAMFNIDCNGCVMPYEFFTKDSINFIGSALCPRRGCLETDVISVTYSGKYKIWIEDGFLIIRTKEWDHVYK